MYKISIKVKVNDINIRRRYWRRGLRRRRRQGCFLFTFFFVVVMRSFVLHNNKVEYIVTVSSVTPHSKRCNKTFNKKNAADVVVVVDDERRTFYYELNELNTAPDTYNLFIIFNGSILVCMSKMATRRKKQSCTSSLNNLHLVSPSI